MKLLVLLLAISYVGCVTPWATQATAPSVVSLSKTTSVTVSWAASKTSGVTYYIYISNGCTGSFTRHASTKSLSYIYNQPTGTTCYYITAYSKTESAPSNTVSQTVP